MQGKRVYPRESDGHLWLQDGEYGKDNDDVWHCRPPGNHTGCLSEHQVTEHEDGAITVSPSILINDGRKTWHGFLERGVWREC